MAAPCPPAFTLPLAASAALGRVIGKELRYLSGRGMWRLPVPRCRGKIDAAWTRFVQRRRRTGVFLFASAFTGVPPFSAVSVLPGLPRLSLGVFWLAGVLERRVRFGSVLSLPQRVRLWA